MSEKAKSYLKEGRIMTAKSESMCGLTLEIGKIYVIAGKNGPTVNLCNYVKAYKDMTTVERRGFAGLYRKGCNACSVSIRKSLKILIYIFTALYLLDCAFISANYF